MNAKGTGLPVPFVVCAGIYAVATLSVVKKQRENRETVKTGVKRHVKKDVKKSVSQKRDVNKSGGPVERRVFPLVPG